MARTGGLFGYKIPLLNNQSHINNDREKFYKDQFKQNTTMAAVVAVLLGLKIGNAVYMVAPDHATLGNGVLLTDLIEYLKLHPFDLFPFAWQWLLIMLIIPVIVGLNSYQEFLKKRNTMWKDAHGSGGFEKNYAGFYREFVYDPAIIGGGTMAIGEGKKVSTKIDHVTKKNLQEKVLYLVDKQLPWTRNNLITPKNVADCVMNSQIYSNSVMMSLNTRLTQRNLSCTVLGASGSGKSRFIVKPNLLQANSSYVVTDPSGENLASTAAFLESQGYIVKVFNLKDMEMSNRYNPFQYISSDKDIPALVNCLKNNIDSAGTGVKKDSGANKFWDDSTIALLCALVGYLYEAFTDDEQYLVDQNGAKIPMRDENGQICIMHDVDGNPLLDKNGEAMVAYEPNPYWNGKRNFKNVMAMIRMSSVQEDDPSAVDDLDQLFADWEASHPKSFAVNQYKTFKLASGKTSREILVSTAVLLGNYFDLDACTNLTYTDDMELEKLGQQKMVIYIITPEGDTTFNWLAACLYSQIFTLLYAQGEANSVKRGNDDVSLEVPVRLLIDEMANIGSIPSFNTKLATMRKYKISAMPIFQSRSQLDGCFDKQAETMIENCDTMVFLGGAGEKTTKELSGKLGKETIKTFSYGSSYGKSGSFSDNRQEIAHDVLSPDEIARLRNDECLIWIRGLRPFCSKKYVYENHPNYKYTPEGSSDEDKRSHKWEYSIKKFQTVYSDDVIQAASVYSPSDPRYDLYRDPMVLAMIAKNNEIESIDVSKDLTIQGTPARGPIFIGKRYQCTNKQAFLDANNLQKQIAAKKKAGEQRMRAMGIEPPESSDPSDKVNTPSTQNSSVKPETSSNAKTKDLENNGAGGKTQSEREHIKEIIKNIDPDANFSEEQMIGYEAQNLSDGEIKERFTLESQFAPDFEYDYDDFPAPDEESVEEEPEEMDEQANTGSFDDINEQFGNDPSAEDLPF